MTVIHFDCEFVEDGRTIDLLSIGMVRDDGATYYAEPAETDRSRANPWVVANVLPHLNGPVKPRAMIATEIVRFAGPDPEFWAYFGAYDWVAPCQLYGTMMDLPDGWPMWCRDVKQEADRHGFDDLGQRVPMVGEEHNALADAYWTRRAHLWILDIDAELRAP